MYINPAGPQKQHEAEASCSSALAPRSNDVHPAIIFSLVFTKIISMTDDGNSDNAHAARTSTGSRTVDAIAQSDDQTFLSVEEVVPLFDIIDTCLEELPVLREVMPSRHARACLMSDGGQDIIVSFPQDLNYLLGGLDGLDRTEHTVLIIEDIDAGWFQALATQFPASLDIRFLAQHVLRMGEVKATYDSHDSLRDGYRTLVGRVDAEISRRLPGTTVNSDSHSQHIDGYVARYGIDSGPVWTTAPGKDGYRWEVFSK
jgi:hypothetical protein